MRYAVFVCEIPGGIVADSDNLVGGVHEQPLVAGKLRSAGSG